MTTTPQEAPNSGLIHPRLGALVRRCDVCGIINACDLDATPARWRELQLPDHTVMRVTEDEAMELWKNAGRCDHKKYIEELRSKIHTQNAMSYALHQIMRANLIMWDSDTEQEFKHAFRKWAKKIAQDAYSPANVHVEATRWLKKDEV